MPTNWTTTWQCQLLCKTSNPQVPSNSHALTEHIRSTGYHRIAWYILYSREVNGKGSSSSSGESLWENGQWMDDRQKELSYAIGPNIRTPRTCVSFPFIWFSSTTICKTYALIGGGLRDKRVNAICMKFQNLILSTDITKTHWKSWSLSTDKWTSLDKSKVSHPVGLSSVNTRTSCRSPRLVPARMHTADGVYESSSGKLRKRAIFYLGSFSNWWVSWFAM